MLDRKYLLIGLAVLPVIIPLACGGSGGFETDPNIDGGPPQGGSGGQAGSAGGTATGGSAGSAGSAGAGTGGSMGGAAGSAGVAGVAGVGGAPCVDGDGDGFDNCTDCDDTDPLAFPGGTEVCGDGIDQDCDGTADPMSLCQGIGTFVSDLTGNDTTGDGTQANPVKTIGAGMANAMTLQGGQGDGGAPVAQVPVFVAEGSYAEKIMLVEGIDLLGGFQCDSRSCTWTRDPAMHKADIQNTDFSGVLVDHTITRATRIDGFTISALDGDPGTGGNGLVGMTIKEGSPTISNNTINGGDVIGCSNQCNTAAIVLEGPANDPLGVLIQNNVIGAGDTPGRSSAINFNFNSGGERHVAEIVANTITGGTGSSSRAIQGFAMGDGSVVRGNDIFAGDGRGSTNFNNFHTSFAMIISSEPGGPSGAITIDANRINADPNLTGNCLNPPNNFFCGGIESEGATAVITNNIVFGMESPRSTGIFLGDGEVPFGEVILNGNTVGGGGFRAGPGGLGLSAALSCRTNQGTNAFVGNVRNNILLGGLSANRFGFYEQEDFNNNSRTCSPVIYENNDIFFPPQPNATDNAHRRHTGGGNIVLHATAADVDTNETWSMNNIAADCQLDSTFHIATGTMCTDGGTATEAPAMDFDGEARPKGAGIDIGADEAE